MHNFAEYLCDDEACTACAMYPVDAEVIIYSSVSADDDAELDNDEIMEDFLEEQVVPDIDD